MSNKIQGEGDYEAARRFNKDEQDFVKRKLGKKHTAGKPDPALDTQEDNENEAFEHASQQPRQSADPQERRK